jgi:hypothetical protein
MLAAMSHPTLGVPRWARWMLGMILLGAPVPGQERAAKAPPDNGGSADTTALVLARKYLQGGDDARTAVLQALQLMGWGVRNAKGSVLQAPPAGADTGLAMRDYELDELLWKPGDQPSVRLISAARALAVPFEDADPEALAQDLVETVRQGAVSSQPQQRFWAQYIIALGRVGPAGYDLAAAAPLPIIPPSQAQIKRVQEEAKGNPFAMIGGLQPKLVWPYDDPVLAPSPPPKRPADPARPGAYERDQQRVSELSEEMGRLAAELGSGDPARQKAGQEKMIKLSTEAAPISQRLAAASMQQAAAVAGGAEVPDGGPRFIAEHRDQPLSLLQIALLTRVLSADLRLAAAKAGSPKGQAAGTAPLRLPPLPLAMIGVARQSAQAPGPPTSAGAQFAGAAGDIWATGSGAYTGAMLEHHLPNSQVGRNLAIANAIMAWLKTIISVARQNIKIDVENTPLVRTKTRTPGEQRTARCTVKIDFPKSDVLKAVRAAGNIAALDLQAPDGGKVGGAKVVWRLLEGGEATKYETAQGGSEYRPELATVQFAQGGIAAYTSFTNDDGEATTTLEGRPQRRDLSSTVRKYPRRGVVAVEVTIKVGNLTQDLNDAISTALGGPVFGALGFLADMVLRTSFFFQNGQAFPVTDWKEPAWEGTFDITVAGNGSKHEAGGKGGPGSDYAWNLNHRMEGWLLTPGSEEEDEQVAGYANVGGHALVVDGDSRNYRVNDESSSHSGSSHNLYTAVGPFQVRPPARNQFEYFTRAAPSGSASMEFSDGKMTLELQPAFTADCYVGRSESGHGRSVNKAGIERLQLLGSVTPATFTFVEAADANTDQFAGTKVFPGKGYLPYVPEFDVTITVKYRLWKNDPPPRAAK